ncbi:MAG: iron transporter [Candidatus Methylomirabilales bacterium]
MRTVGHLEIALYVWGPQEVIHPKGDAHHKPGEVATHLDVRVYDLRRKMYIPYLTIKATITDRTKKRDVTVELEPMIGEWLHYGANITLPHPGTYSILLDIQPPDIARHQHLADSETVPWLRVDCHWLLDDARFFSHPSDRRKESEVGHRPRTCDTPASLR